MLKDDFVILSSVFQRVVLRAPVQQVDELAADNHRQGIQRGWAAPHRQLPCGLPGDPGVHAAELWK